MMMMVVVVVVVGDRAHRGKGCGCTIARLHSPKWEQVRRFGGSKDAVGVLPPFVSAGVVVSSLVISGLPV